MKAEQFKPLVSIITIVYNGEKYIEQTIKSVLNQTYTNIEYIIIDGGSVDGTLNIIKQYEHAITKWISEKDNGISDAFNKGIKIAKGELIGMINADDWYELDAIEKIADNFVDNQTLICGNVKLYNNDVKFNIKRSSLDKIYREMTIWHPGLFVHKDIYKKVGLYDENYKILMDYDFVIRCMLAGYKFNFVNENIANMRYGGVSNRLISKSMKEGLKIKNVHFKTHTKNFVAYLYLNFYYQTIIFIKKLIY